EDRALRVGCLAAVLGHLAEGCFGIDTAVPSALFWMTSAMLTAPVMLGDAEARPRSRQASGLWMTVLGPLAIVGGVTTAATSVWLLGLRSYTHGIFAAAAGRPDVARFEFLQATRLVPWLPAPRSMAAEAGLRVADLEPDPTRRATMLGEIEALLAGARGG